MAINSKIHIIFFIFLTNNVHFLKILLDNLIFFLFPKFLELFSPLKHSFQCLKLKNGLKEHFFGTPSK